MNKAWIAKGGQALLVTVGAANEDPLAHLSDSESEVMLSDEVLPSPWQVVPKVVQSDEFEYTLDKGAWVVTPAKHHGWEIFIMVSYP